MTKHIEKTFSGSKVDLNYAEFEGEGPPIVIAHGFSGRWQGHLPYVEKLPGFHVFAVDQSGHGKSGVRSGTYKLMDFSDDMVEFIENVTGPNVAYIGMSLGAMVGMVVAGREPELIKTLVLGDAPYSLVTKNFMGSWLQKYRAETREELNEGVDVEEETKKIAAANPTWTPEQAKIQAVSLSQVRPEASDALADGTFPDGWNSDEAFKNTTAATLILQGDDQTGGFQPDSDVNEMLGAYSDANAVKFYGLGHSLDYRTPSTPFSVLNSFLAERHTG